MVHMKRNLLISTVVIYLILSLFFSVSQQYIPAVFLKPGAAIFTFLSLGRAMKLPLRSKVKKLIRAAFLCWFITDLIVVTGTMISNRCGFNMVNFKHAIFGLYIIPRVLILIFMIELYHFTVIKSNRFRIALDVLTLTACSCITIWLTYVRGRTNVIMDEKFLYLMKWDNMAIYELIYTILSLSILSLLLLSWFQFHNRVIAAGQKMILCGIAGIAVTDLLRISFMEMPGITAWLETSYALWIVLIGFGGINCSKLPHEVTPARVKTNLFNGLWKNTFYLFGFQLYTLITIGWNRSVLSYLLVIVYYYISCLYLQQIFITDSLLTAEKKYNHKLKLYSNIIEQIPLSIMITDVNANVSYVNPYFTKISGYSLDELAGKIPRFMKSEKTPHSVYSEMWQKLQRGDRWNGEFFSQKKNGEEYEHNAIIIPIKDELNMITNYAAIMVNLTETKKIQSQLTNQYYFTSQLLDALPCTVFYMDPSGTLLGANKQCKKDYGVYSNNLDGTKLSDAAWMDEEKNKDFVRMQEETLRTNRPSIRQIARRLADGRECESLYNISAFYLADGALGGFLGLMTDVTELKQKEEELKEALKYANEATEAKTQFLANMSHEIRTPMNAIIGMSYLTLKTNLSPKQTDYITKIYNAATSLLGIINDILDFTKIDSGKLNIESIEFSLNKVITDSIGLFMQKASEKGLEILYHLPFDIPDKIIGDPLRLGQIMNNLISNAVKFTQHGEIYINVSMENKTEQQVLLKFSVRDTGIGINDKNRDNLFDAFTQSDSSTTREYGGTGLGLAICRRLTELMGGSLWFDSEYAKGSVFYFTLWLKYIEDSSLESNMGQDSFREMKVLVVDDNIYARSILKEYLMSMGFQVDTAESGEEALLKVTQNTEKQYQVAFIDWKMNGMNGLQTVEAIRKQENLFFKPSVILVTEFDVDEIMKNAGHIRVEGYLSKPVSKSTLYKTITDLFALNVDNPSEKTEFCELNYKLKRLNVLLAEDNEINQQIVIELLAASGINTEIANNGFEAVEKVKNMLPEKRYDVILMDYQMPVMDGFEAAKLIHEMEKDIPIIALTARTMLEEKEKCFDAGMVDHISKPIDPVSFLTAIMKWADPNKEKLNQKLILKGSGDKDGIGFIIEGIDTKSGLKRVSNKTTLYLKLLQDFAKNLKHILYQMKFELAKDDLHSVNHLAHTLKGVSGNIGAITIQNLSESIELMAKSREEKEKILKQYIVLCNEANRVIGAINLQINSGTYSMKTDRALIDIDSIDF